MDIHEFLVYCFVSVIVAVLLFSISLLPIGFLFNNIGASTGQHTVYVTAVEFNDNAFFDSTLVYVKTSQESTQEDVYCVNDGVIKSRLERAAINGERVTINYSNPFWFWRSLCNGGVSVITGAFSVG